MDKAVSGHTEYKAWKHAVHDGVGPLGRGSGTPIPKGMSVYAPTHSVSLTEKGDFTGAFE